MIILVRPDDESKLKICDIYNPVVKKEVISRLHDPVPVKEVMSHLQVIRNNACEALRQATAKQLTYHPMPGKWSAIEQLRHLVFAEDLYLNRWILRNNAPWIPIGLLPDFWKNEEKFSDVGKEPTEDLDRILSVWSNLHEGTNDFVANVTSEILKQDTSDIDCGQGTVGAILQQLANHDYWHLNKAQLSINANNNA